MSSCFHLLSFPPPPLRRLELYAMFHSLGSLSGAGSWLLNGCVWKWVLPANGNFDRGNWWSTNGFCGTLVSDRPKWERFWTIVQSRQRLSENCCTFCEQNQRWIQLQGSAGRTSQKTLKIFNLRHNSHSSGYSSPKVFSFKILEAQVSQMSRKSYNCWFWGAFPSHFTWHLTLKFDMRTFHKRTCQVVIPLLSHESITLESHEVALCIVKFPAICRDVESLNPRWPKSSPESVLLKQSWHVMTRRISKVWFCWKNVNCLTTAQKTVRMRQCSRSELFAQALCQELGHEVT